MMVTTQTISQINTFTESLTTKLSSVRMILSMAFHTTEMSTFTQIIMKLTRLSIIPMIIHITTMTSTSMDTQMSTTTPLTMGKTSIQKSTTKTTSIQMHIP